MPRKNTQRSSQNNTDLLNFKLPQRPKQAQASSSSKHRPSYNQKKPYSTPKRKTGLFPLHCSPDHAFVITRQSYHGGDGQYSFQGSDNVVSWESVRIVKYLTPTILECPVCLDSFQCPRITKCGHCFCLTCLIHHVQTSSSETPKCPCCSIPIHLTDTRAVQMTMQVSVSEPVRRFVKLHRAKTCPAPYLPRIDQPRRGTSHAAPTVDDADAPFCRFNYVNPVLYQELLNSNLKELETDHQGGTMMEDLCKGLAIQMIQDDMAKARAEAMVEQSLAEQFLNPVSGVTMAQPSYLVAQPIGRARGDSIVSCGGESQCSTNTASSSTHAKYGGSMYLDESEEFMFYQADDGSLCFLSGFNIKCLRSEFSAEPSVATDMSQLSVDEQQTHSKVRVKPPLPDYVEGRIIEMERGQLTREMRERLRFLSHVPLYTEITFIEIAIGHLLSSATKKAFKKEFNKRNQKRSEKTIAEKRADEKLKRQEEERVKELKARYQRIDPTDEFFRAPAMAEPPVNFSEETFGPAIGTVPSGQSSPAPSPAFSFSQVIRAGEAFPSLKAANTESNFPSLGAAAIPTTQTTMGWGAKAAKKPQAQCVGLGASKVADKLTPLVSSQKKGLKGKKVVLLSTTHRGGL